MSIERLKMGLFKLSIEDRISYFWKYLKIFYCQKLKNIKIFTPKKTCINKEKLQ